MTAKTLKRLGLETDAKDDAIEGKVVTLLDSADAAASTNAEESEINKLIGASGGALDRKRAKQVLANRAGYIETQKAAKAKKK